ncbi:MAG: undecaprenyl-diphosphate phosphatase [Eubacteriales bacterium]|nr:undecaprenyl-diphosphate phosphatase [Eubacteriales bacterium]
MSAIIAILLGILQGLTEFLPVSSFGHIDFIENALGISHNAGILFESMLHFGTLAGLFAVFQKDIRKIIRSYGGMLLDSVGNLNLYVHNRRTGEDLRYTRIVSDPYRKLSSMLLVTSIATASLGFSARRLALTAKTFYMAAGIGLLLTGVFLIVVDVSGAGGNKHFRDAGYDSAVWIGICQGLSVFPGVSRCGLTYGCGLLCGYQQKFAIKYSFLASVPAIIGACIVEFPYFWTSGITAGQGFIFVLGMIFSGITGYFVVRFMIRLTQNLKLRYFAFYCFLAGAIGLAINLY